MSASPLQSPIRAPAAAAGTPGQQTPSQSQTPRADSEDTAREALKTLQGELVTYKREKAENERLLNEQLEKMRKDVSDFRVQNAQLTSQV